MKIYTIGHSTRSFEEFIDICKIFNIELVFDVRRIAGSKRFPHFNKECLEVNLLNAKIDYVHFQELGGYRKEGYLAFSQSKEFMDAIEKLLGMIDGKIVVIFCAEILWWRCHRRYIAETLAIEGNHVIHIFNKNKIQEHEPEKREIKEKMKLKIFCDKKAKKMLS
jgi:uncharacterized protein (DUF488 family)